MATARDRVITEILTETQQSVGGIKNLLSNVVKLTAAYAAAKRIAQEAFQNAQLAAAFNQQEIAFQNLAQSAGVSSDALLNALDKAAGGTIESFRLMQLASRAAVLGMPMDELARLMEISRASALAMGESVEFMFDSLVTGIVRASPLLIDNVLKINGISSALDVFADKLGVSADDLSEAGRQQALLNLVMTEGQGIVDKMGDAMVELTDRQQIDNAKTAFIEWRTEMGQNLLPILREAAKLTSELFGGLAERARTLRLSRELFDMTVGQGERSFSDLDREQAQRFIDAARSRQAILEADIESMRAQLGAFPALKDPFGLVRGDIERREQDINRLETALRMLQSRLRAIGDEGGVAGALGGGGGGAGGGGGGGQGGGEGLIKRTVTDVGVLAASLGEISDIIAGQRIAGGGGDDLGLGGLLTPQTVPALTKAAIEAGRLRKEVDEMIGEGIAQAAGQAFVDSMRILGESLALGAAGAEQMGAALAGMLSNFLNSLSMILLEAGLRTIIANPNDPRGWGLLIASGLTAIIGGAVGASPPTGTSVSTSVTRGTGGANMLAAPSQQAGTVLVQNNITVQGSVVTERQLAASMQRLAR